MIELVGSLPQGVFWYPVVAGLLIVVARALREIAGTARGIRRAHSAPPNALAGYAHLIQRAAADASARNELERLCIGLVLQASGYRNYSVDACRHYIAHAAPEHLAAVLGEHLGDATTVQRPRAGVLPPGCELLVKELERQTAEGRPWKS